MTDPNAAVAIFSRHRQYLFAVAYRLLGIAEDAEDLVQEAWLRFSRAKDTTIDNPRAYLITVITRLALDLMRSARYRREEYVGVWLPEPIPSKQALPPDLVEKKESVSFAFLLLLERLNPVERAVLVLHDVFEYTHKEIALTIERTPEATRKALHRARRKFGETPPPRISETDHSRRLVSQFLHAALSGDMHELIGTLASDVVLMSDGGGKVLAAMRPLAGSQRVGRFLASVQRIAPPGTQMILSELNAQPAILVIEDGIVTNAFIFDGTHAGLTAIYVVRNPDKLGRVSQRASPSTES